MLGFSNIKINLGLSIISKRNDGYHNIESIFYPIKNYCDAIEILPSDRFKLHTRGGIIPGKKQDNIIFKAYKLLKEEYKIPPVEILLLKNIPSGSGLGGGSSNGTATLKMLDTYFELNIPGERLHHFAQTLGSDCPFFLHNKPMLVSGRGETLKEIDLNLENYHFAIITPNISVSTKEAYASLKPALPGFPVHEIVKKPIENWRMILRNDFEKYIGIKYPEIIEIKEKLYSAGSLFASVSGSGSSVFGLFENKTALPAFPDNYKIWQGKPGNTIEKMF